VRRVGAGWGSGGRDEGWITRSRECGEEWGGRRKRESKKVLGWKEGEERGESAVLGSGGSVGRKG